jgi:hypothetical protein
MNQPGRPPWPARDRRYDWFRVYNDFVGHSKFRYVAKHCGVTVSEASMIALALFVAANKSKPRGWVSDFDPFECSAALDVETERVVAVFQMFEDQDWITGDYLSTWDKRQPDKEDPGAAERQRRRRARLKAARAGQAKPAPAEAKSAAPAVEANDARLSAQYWLFSEGKEIVCGRTGMKALAAELTIKRWLNDTQRDPETLQAIIRAAAAENLNGDAFRNQVGGRVDAARRLATAGPPLPLGPSLVGTG